MQIFVKTLGGKTISLNIDRSEMIRSVKRKLQDKEGIPSDVVQTLTYAGNQLDDELTLGDCDISEDSTLHLFTRKRLPDIHVKTLSGKTISLSMEGLNTIEDVKAKINEQEGIPPDEQQLFFAGRQLDGVETLFWNVIELGSTPLLALQHTGKIKNREGPQSAPTQLNVTSPGQYNLRKHPADGPAAQVAPRQTKRGRPATQATPNVNSHSIFDTSDGKECAEYVQGLAASADHQAMSHDAKLNFFALNHAKATAALSDLMLESRAHPREMATAHTEKELESTISRLTHLNTELSSRCASYESQVFALVAEDRKTKEELMAAYSKKKELEANITALLSSICASYESQDMKTKEELTIARSKEKELESTISALRHENTELSSRCTSYESQVFALLTEDKKTKEELMVSRSREKELETTISGLTRENTELSSRNASNESQVSALVAEDRRTKKELMVSHSKEKELEAKISGFTRLNTELSSRCASYESRVSALVAEVKKTKEELMVARSKENELEASISGKLHENTKLSSRCATYESQVFALEAEDKKIKEELMVAHSKEKELKATISGLTNKNKVLSDQCASYGSQLVALKAENKKTKEELIVYCRKKKELEATNSGLIHKNKKFSDQCASYEHQVAALEAENKKTIHELMVASRKEKEQEATISRLTHKNKVFSAECSSYECQIVALEAEYKKTKEELLNADTKFYSGARAAGYVEGLKEGKTKWLKSVDFLHHLTEASMHYFDYGFDSCQKQAEQQGFVGHLNKDSALKEAPELKGQLQGVPYISK